MTTKKCPRCGKKIQIEIFNSIVDMDEEGNDIVKKVIYLSCDCGFNQSLAY
jgi:hypothetical protein